MSTNNINIDPLKLLNAFNAEGYDRGQTTRQWYGQRLRPYFEFLATEGIRLEDSGPLVVHPDLLPTAPLFVTMRGGRQLAPRTVNGIISRWAKAADVPCHVSVSPHYWRRTFATNYAADGGDVFSLQEIMGHTNIETTRIYIAASQKWVQEQHRRHSPLNHLNLE